MVLFIGNSKDTSANSSSKPKETKDAEEIKGSEEKEKDRDKDRKQSVSFPPSNTTDSVRLKSRELLANALRQGKSEYLKKKKKKVILIRISLSDILKCFVFRFCSEQFHSTWLIYKNFAVLQGIY